jgi:hypothetical protein
VSAAVAPGPTELAELRKRVETLEARLRGLSGALSVCYSYAGIPLPVAVGGTEPPRDRGHLQVVPETAGLETADRRDAR